MRAGAFLFASAVATLVATPSRASEPDPALAVALGAATILTGFIVGGTLIGASAHPRPSEDAATDNARNTAGWFAIEGGFVLAPLASHAVVGEWGRGALLSALPAAATIGTIPILAMEPDAVAHGSLPQQRWMWGLFCGAMATSVAGVVDAAFARDRAAPTITPVLGRSGAGILVAGAL